MRIFVLLFLVSQGAHAFTLNSNFAASFKKNRVNVAIAGDSACLNQNVTAADLESYIKPAINRFWNEVPTSRLRLKAAGFTNPLPTVDINTARLCSPTDDTCVQDATTKGQDIIPPVSGIVITCNNLADNYDGNSVVAVTVPNAFSGKKITGAVILINDSASAPFKNLTRDDRIGVIAHEIGHAIGLGHSEDAEALMYYKVQDIRKSLGQDDVDGVTYLYPVKIDGCGLMDSLVSSTIALKKNNSDKGNGPQNGGGTPFWQMGIALMICILISELLRLRKSSQARPAL